MKRILYAAIGLMALSLSLGAQTTDWKARYESLAKRVGVSGVGIETILDKWAGVDSLNADLLKARFCYWLDKSEANTQVVSLKQRKYLGMDPILALKDSTGTDVYYFQETVYDEAMFSKAMRYVDKAAKVYPERLDFRVDRISSLLAYEKESPDMALSSLLDVIDENAKGKYKWIWPGYDKVDNALFNKMVQEYCAAFFTIASPVSREAFRTVAQKMLSHDKKNVDFLSDMGSYYLVKKEHKSAFKYYDKVLKIQPENYTVIKNCATASIQLKDVKLQKKYLPMLVKYGSESEKLSAQARLDSISGKK